MVDKIEIDGKVYEVKYTKTTIDGVEVNESLNLVNGDTVFKLSPNTTEAELKKYADPSEKGYNL